MANVSVFDMQGKEVGKMDLNDAVFGVEINEHLLHLAVVAQLANKRQGTQKALTRAEVSGGGRKPWRQKGTGHARQGSIRAPQWKGGGVVFAPTPRDYTTTMNKKEKILVKNGKMTIRTDSTLELDGNDNGGVVIAPELKKQLGFLTQRVDTIINALQNAPTAAMDGGAAYKTGIVAALATIVNKENFSNIESDKVRHGKGGD